MGKQRVVALATGLAMCGTMSGAALAQEQDSRFEEIVVTARKREERLQTVPITATALSAKQLDKLEVNNVQDLVRAVPGVSYYGFDPGRAKISIRGIVTTTIYPTTGFYLDDVPIGNGLLGGLIGQLEPMIFDTQRVEVLKGPQGTLYGGSAMGGAIKFVTNQPVLDKVTGSVGLKLATTDGGAPTYDGRGVLNAPIVAGKVAARVSAEYREDGGYIDRIAHARYQAVSSGLSGTTRNSQTVDDANTTRSVGAHAAVLFAPDDSLTITPSLYYQRLALSDQSQFWTFLPGLQQSYELPRPGFDRSILPVLTINKSLGDFNLTSITSYLNRTQTTVNDYYLNQNLLESDLVNLPAPVYGNGQSKNFTQELRAAYDSPDSRLHVVTGAYLQREKSYYRQSVEAPGYGATPYSVPRDVLFVAATGYTTRQLALFGDVSYSVLRDLDVSVGLRKFWIDQSYDRYGNGYFNGGLSVAHGNASYNGLNPKVSISYKLTDDNMVYASAAKGFRPGGVTTSVPSSRCAADLAALGLKTTPASYGPDDMWNYEIGTKNNFRSIGLHVNAALYYINWSKIQQSTSLPTCGFSYTDNVGSAVSQGGEFEIRYSLLQGLSLGFSGTYNDAHITESRAGTQAQVGDPVLYTPKWIFNLDAEYEFPLFGYRGFVRADYQWHGSQFQRFNRLQSTPTGNIPYQVYQQNYSQANASIGIDGDVWSGKLYVLNFTNNRPLLNYQTSYDATLAQTLRPRTIGISIDRKF